MYQVCVSGAARGKTTIVGARAAFELGEELAKRGHAVFTGATTGLPYQAALGAKAQKGQSVGFSPASSPAEHTKKYHLPSDAYDLIIYTGLHYIGRDLFLVQSSDALISIGGRVGTWHEFTIAFETKTPIAVLDCFGGVSAEFQTMLKAAGRRGKHIIYEQDPARLVNRLLADLNKRAH